MSYHSRRETPLWERGLNIGTQALSSYASHRIRNYFQSSRAARAKASWNARLNMGAHNRMDESELTQDGAGTSRTQASFSSNGSVITGTRHANRQMLNARRLLRGVRATNTRPTAMKAAMYLPGKGAEVDLIHNNHLQPITHKIAWKSDKLRHDGVTSAFVNPKGNRISMDFALKMILECQTIGMTGNRDPAHPNDLAPTRFHCCHIFRHTNPASTSSENGTTMTNKTMWHSTLGPDAAYTRLLPADGGTRQGTAVFNANFTNTLKSPYREPLMGQPMYTRLNLMALENFGWNLNPFKITDNLTGPSFIVENLGNVEAFNNVSPAEVDDVAIKQSAPYTQLTGNNSTTPNVSANKYVTQHGPGGVRYNFSNDGTNAVTIECVIVAFKKNANTPDMTDTGLIDPYGMFMESMAHAQVNYAKMKVGVLTLGGDPHTQVPTAAGTVTPTTYYSTPGPSIFSNAETDFIPNNLWRHMGHNQNSVAAGSLSNQPFKYVSRDQFIIGGGQSRIWKTAFPSDVYFAPDDSPQAKLNVNSHSFMVIWSVCSAPLPCMETAQATNSATDITVQQGKIMLSREPQNCNVSVVGTYFETPTPVFCKKEPVPINITGSLAQVSVLPWNTLGNVDQWPVGSHPSTAVTTPIYNQMTTPDGLNPSETHTNGLIYVDLPRSGQQPFTENAVDTLQIGTLSTLG